MPLVNGVVVCFNVRVPLQKLGCLVAYAVAFLVSGTLIYYYTLSRRVTQQLRETHVST